MPYAVVSTLALRNFLLLYRILLVFAWREAKRWALFFLSISLYSVTSSSNELGCRILCSSCTTKLLKTPATSHHSGSSSKNNLESSRDQWQFVMTCRVSLTWQLSSSLSQSENCDTQNLSLLLSFWLRGSISASSFIGGNKISLSRLDTAS